MTTLRRGGAALVLGALAAALLAWWLLRARPAPDAPGAGGAPASGGALVATLRSEPETFNRYVGVAFPTHLVAALTQARLVRINRVTQQLEPWLAERWDAAADGLRYRLHLREGITFADGQPFTADDVVFSFAAMYDERTGSPLGDAVRVDGKPLAATAVSPHEVEVRFPAPYGPGLRLLDNVPIYPRHKLGAALEGGTLREAWGPLTDPAEMTGLGPFVLERYEPGQRLVLARNPRYWRTDREGRRLPYLDRLTLEIVPDQNAELLRLQAGQIDLMQNELRPEDYLPVKERADAGRLRLVDVGTGLDTHLLWFNLAPRAAPDPRGGWLRRDELRLAVSHAVDRDAFARTVYLGAAEPSWGLVSPANKEWYSASAPRHPFDPARAASLLAAAGLADRNGDGRLDDETGAAARLTLLVQKGVTASEKGAAFVRDALGRLGLTIDVVALDLSAVMGRWMQRDYDAIYHFMSATDTDPAGNLDLWLSSGSAHVWHPRQASPATPWERAIDDLMRRQASSLDLPERQRLFAEVQRLAGEHAPAMSFAVPHVYIAASRRVGHFTPAVQRPQVLWDAGTLAELKMEN